MNEVAMLSGAEPRKILQTVVEEKTPAVMSYLSKGKWHVAKVLLTGLGANRLNVNILPRKKPYPINIQVDQPVGISLKYGYGKFIFETKVTGLEPSPGTTSGGTILLAVPDRIEIIQRRSYFRVEVPNSLKVNVLLWHRCHTTDDGECGKECLATPDNEQMPTDRYCQGKLVDISAGGLQIAVDSEKGADFKKGQFIGLRFTPMPYETPLMFNAQIRNILPTVDNKSICFGLQIVGLEASPEGRQVLQRLCNVVERYYQINQSSAKQQDMKQPHFVDSQPITE
ncbi:MAG: flagellar brake protein [Planctomycetota bacterium]